MTFIVKTTRREEFADITSRVADAVREAGLEKGLCLVFVPHTTAGVTVNEAADPDVATDILAALDRMAPRDFPFRHAEGNSPAHVKASLMGSSVTLSVAEGRLVLGAWQGVFLCEFDGPRARKVLVSLIPERL